MAAGVALAFWISQAANWQGSFLAAILAAAMLTLPLPAPSLRGGIGFVLVLLGGLLAGLVLVPLIQHQPLAGVVALILVLFGGFFYAAGGGSPIVGAFLIIGLTVVPVVGSESVDAAITLTRSFTFGAIIAVLCVWVAHALFPEPPRPHAAGGPPPKPPPPERATAARMALRSLLVVIPPVLWILATSGTASYAAALMKIATLGQQATADQSHTAGRSLLMSTLIGGAAAVALWWVLQIWPSLLVYTLLVLLSGLLFGPRIFRGPARAPLGPMWSYAYMTMVIIVAPAAMDTAGGAGAGAGFVSRMIMLFGATLYAVVAVTVFDRWVGAGKPAPALADRGGSSKTPA